VTSGAHSMTVPLLHVDAVAKRYTRGLISRNVTFSLEADFVVEAPTVVGVMGPKKALTFPFKYTFTVEDAEAGKVSFRAVATIQNARDAAEGDNVATTFPTLVTK